MPRYIDVESLKLNCKICLSDEDAEILKDALNDMIRNAPAVDVEPVRHGHWVTHEYWHGVNMDNTTMVTRRKSHYGTCSLCGEWGERQKNYCPECGAKMDEEVMNDVE